MNDTIGICSACVVCGKEKRCIDLKSEFVTSDVLRGKHIKFTCSECGEYLTAEKFAYDYSKISAKNLSKKREKNLHNIRGYLREAGDSFIITKDNFDSLLDTKDIKVNEKLKKLLLFIYQNTDVGEVFYTSPSTSNNSFYLRISSNSPALPDNLINVIWGKTIEQVQYLINELLKRKYISRPDNPQYPKEVGYYVISSIGYEYIESLQNTTSDIAFCAMWFAQEMNEAWAKSISPAIKDAGYDEKRIDIHDHNNVILEEIEGLIRQSRFIVVDLTGHRGGVYFEAGFAKALNIPIIYTCEKEHFKDIHFDVKHFNCLKWELDNLGDFKKNLQTRIENTLGKGRYVISK